MLRSTKLTASRDDILVSSAIATLRNQDFGYHFGEIVDIIRRCHLAIAVLAIVRFHAAGASITAAQARDDAGVVAHIAPVFVSGLKYQIFAHTSSLGFVP
jgi:hypothetical protein